MLGDHHLQYIHIDKIDKEANMCNTDPVAPTYIIKLKE